MKFSKSSNTSFINYLYIFSLIILYKKRNTYIWSFKCLNFTARILKTKLFVSILKDYLKSMYIVFVLLLVKLLFKKNCLKFYYIKQWVYIIKESILEVSHSKYFIFIFSY